MPFLTLTYPTGLLSGLRTAALFNELKFYQKKAVRIINFQKLFCKTDRNGKYSVTVSAVESRNKSKTTKIDFTERSMRQCNESSCQ